MRKSIIIALCCITVLFAACKKEKPYEKFVGDYLGQVLINGTMDVPLFNYNQELVDQPFNMNLTLTQGTTDDQVILTYHPEGQNETYATTGTIVNDFVDFEPINIETDVDQSHIKASFDFEGTLVDNVQLAMKGTINGNGTIQMGQDIPIPTPFTITGTAKGTLIKQVEPEK